MIKILLTLLDFFKSIQTRNCLATWATRTVTIGFISFINSVALNILYMIDCYKFEKTQEIEMTCVELKHYNLIILMLNIIIIVINFMFCIPYNIN
jgi:hypothetical protein